MIFKVIFYTLLVPGVFGNTLVATNKLTLATWGSYHQQDHKGPGTYAFGYDIEDPVTGNIQFKQEERHPNGTITGNYGYVDAEGKPHVVTYISDERGYRAKVEIEGQPTQYYPSVGSFSENSYRSPRNKAERLPLNTPNILDVSETNINAIDQDNNNYPIYNKFPLLYLYRFNFPSYFKYARINEIQQ